MPLRELQNLGSNSSMSVGYHPQQHKVVHQVHSTGHMASEKTSEDISNALPVFDLSQFLALKNGEVPAKLVPQCQQLAECLASTGCVVVRDPRVAASDNDTFLDLLEQYFSRPAEEKMEDARPALSYQVGATPSGIEVPRCVAEPEGCQQQLQQLAPDAQPVLPTGPDVKWRFMWRVGPRPAETKYAELNADPVIPRGLSSWPAVMDSWGSKLVATVDAVAAMAAVGFGLPQTAFRDRMVRGPHLLAPTGSDLAAHGKAGTVLAGFHYDLNFITIHGRSRFPGLSVWLADGRKLRVAIPAGCLLCQAGKQLEWLTGGHVRAGMHEVVVNDATVAAIAAAKAAERCCWRVSSTVFSHIASDCVLQPLGHFTATAAAKAGQYPAVPAGLQVQQELEVIRLRRNH